MKYGQECVPTSTLEVIVVVAIIRPEPGGLLTLKRPEGHSFAGPLIELVKPIQIMMSSRVANVTFIGTLGS